jgi:flagellin-like hook-associated protein FlgL
MIVQLSTGAIGGSAQLPSRSGGGTPTLSLSRDRQALRTAASFGAALGAAAAGAKAAATGKNLLAAAEVGIVAIEAALADMKIAAKAAKDTGLTASAAGLSDTDRAILHTEFEALRTEITDIVNRTLFDDVKLLDGDGGASRSFSFGTGGGSEPGADTTVTISAASVARLATGLDAANLLTQAAATSAETLVITAQDAAAGIKGALRADQGRLDAGAAIGAAVSAGAGAVRDAGLEYQGIVDEAREAANRVALAGGLNIYGSDGGLKAGNSLTTAFVTGGGSSAPREETGGTRGTDAPRPSVSRPSGSSSSGSNSSGSTGGGKPERASVDISA